MATFYYVKQSDLAPAVTDTLEDKTGAPVNLTGATVKFHMVDRLGNVVVAAGAVTGPGGGPLDATGGVSYAWQGGDTATAGDYFAEWQVTFSGGLVERWPDSDQAIVRITPKLA